MDQADLRFLEGGGELGALMRDHPWERTPLGPLAGWPQSLRTATSILLRSPVPMVLLWGPDGIMLYNDGYAVFAGERHPRLLGAKVREGWDEVADFNDHVMKVGLAGGTLAFKDQELTLNRSGTPEQAWMNLDYSPVQDESGRPAGVLAIVIETTERVRAEAALRASELHARDVLEGMTEGFVLLDRDYRVLSINAEGIELDQRAREDIVGKTHWEAWPDSEHGPLGALYKKAMTERVPVELEHRFVWPDGRVSWFDMRAHPSGDGLAIFYRDISERHAAEAQLRDSRDRLAAERQALEILNDTGTQIAAELDLGRLVQHVVDAGVELTGARFGAFFYNVLDDAGASYMLYALSGAERSKFENFGMPRATQVFAPTFRGEGVVRSDDILADPRYGHNPPHAGMPKGHLPVRSYLAVPVTSRSGAVIGGLFFGHEQTGVFTERAERVMTGLAAQAAIGIDNARLFEATQRANADLEQRVAARTLELEEAHERMRQSQKMEAVGQLTGGIAHDFNNMLAVVVGSLELLRRRVGPDDARAHRYVDAAMDGARRAATLTQRLLVFSRQQPLQPESVDANKLVAGMSELLRRALGSDVQLETVLAGGLWRAHTDPNQLENAILNLSVNARDAMPNGGRLTVETQNAHLDERYVAAQLGLAAGQYVLIAVTDTGTGMTEAVRARAFDPFFTTKEVGKGTGLGLSQVYGFVKQSGGHVRIYSEPGHGTSVKIYLPRLNGGIDALRDDAPLESPVLGETQEVILVVEDEPAVRRFSVDALAELGYRVLEADGAAAALRMLELHPEVSLLFTDIVMPEINGARLAEQARARWPRLRVLFTTGYTRNAIVHNGMLDPGVEMIGKPFTLDQLAAKVRDVLDRAAPG